MAGTWFKAPKRTHVYASCPALPRAKEKSSVRWLCAHQPPNYYRRKLIYIRCNYCKIHSSAVTGATATDRICARASDPLLSNRKDRLQMRWILARRPRFDCARNSILIRKNTFKIHSSVATRPSATKLTRTSASDPKLQWSKDRSKITVRGDSRRRIYCRCTGCGPISKF